MTEGTRKYTMTLAFLVTAIGLVVFNKIPADDFMQYCGMVVMTYMGANVGEHFCKRG